MKKTFINKIINSIGILSIAVATLGLPLLFIGGAGQDVSKSQIQNIIISDQGQPPGFEEQIGQEALDSAVTSINAAYDIIKKEVNNSGFFEIKELSNEVVLAITNIGQQLLDISNKNKPGGSGENYILNTSLYNISNQLKLIVRIDPISKEIINVLQKNIDDNANLAIAGSVMFAVGGTGILIALGLYIYSKKMSKEIELSKISKKK